MANADKITPDSRLHAYVDDQLSPAERAEVEQWLREHPHDAAEVRRWSDDAEALRRAFEPVLREDVPTRLEQIVWNRTPVAMSTRWQRLAAASAVFVLGGILGVALGWTARFMAPDADDTAAAAWAQRAVVAHRVYVPEVRHPVEVDVSDRGASDHAAQAAQLSRWLSARTAVPVRLFDLAPLGFELVGGRLLPDAAGPSAQLMYQQRPGAQRITVYLRKLDAADGPAGLPLAYERLGDVGMFYWTEGDAAFALCGDLPRERLLALAEAIFRQGGLPGRPPRS